MSTPTSIMSEHAPEITRTWSAVLFDLDGTLTDSAPGITQSLAGALEEIGHPVADPDSLTVHVGPPLHETMRALGLDESEAVAATAAGLRDGRSSALAFAGAGTAPGVGTTATSGPVTAANYVLQGEISYAGDAMGRFLVNTTIGVVGIFDVATDWDMPERSRDFGLTLGNVGVPPGPYLVIPFGGSSAVRDLAGSYVDGFFSPLRYVGHYEGRPYVGLVKNVIGTVDNRSRNIDAYRDIERNSVDYYATMRSNYLQRRARLIEQKSVMTAELPDF